MRAARRFCGIATVGLLLAVVSTATAQYGGGTGEPNDPYRIATAADLIALGETPADYDKHFILAADIDLDPNLPGRRIFDRAVLAPDADPADQYGDFQGTAFTGVLDGNRHTIRHLTIQGAGYAGLFGQLGWRAASGGEVRNLGLVDVSVVGSGEYVGGLVGNNGHGTVTRCYSTGTVSGESYYVGGLVGRNDNGSVTYCYSAGAVRSTNSYVGGLVGWNFKGQVTDCYSTAVVGGTMWIGGLVAWNYGGCVTASFWDTQTSGRTTSDGGVGKTTAEMQTASTFLDAGWDFVGERDTRTEDIWSILEGKGYPRLSWQGPASIVFVDIPGGTFLMGDHDGMGQDDERPVHPVTLAGFQMSTHETTNAQYVEFLNAAMAAGLIHVVNGRVYASSDPQQTEPYCDTCVASSYSQIEYSQARFTVRTRDGMTMSDHPMVRVSWYGAKAFCDYYRWRLPTEAEWEYAARGGHHDPYCPYPWGGNSIDCTKANHWSGSSDCNPLNLTSRPYTSPVGYYGPQGAYGLCDMSGNVSEWCQDSYDSSYYSVSPEVNPSGPVTGVGRVLRGGSWNWHGFECRVARRRWDVPAGSNSFVLPHYAFSCGFRACR